MPRIVETAAGSFEVRDDGYVTFKGFCPTGEGGGVDNSCGRGGGSGGSGGSGGDPGQARDTLMGTSQQTNPTETSEVGQASVAAHEESKKTNNIKAIKFADDARRVSDEAIKAEDEQGEVFDTNKVIKLYRSAAKLHKSAAAEHTAAGETAAAKSHTIAAKLHRRIAGDWAAS